MTLGVTAEKRAGGDRNHQGSGSLCEGQGQGGWERGAGRRWLRRAWHSLCQTFKREKDFK